MEEERKLPNHPGIPHNYEGYPEYEEALKKDCPLIRGTCIRGACKRWLKVSGAVPNPLAPGKMDTFELYQCEDDLIINSITQTSDILQQIAMASQMAQQQALGWKLGGMQLPGMRGSG